MYLRPDGKGNRGWTVELETLAQTVSNSIELRELAKYYAAHTEEAK